MRIHVGKASKRIKVSEYLKELEEDPQLIFN